MNKEEEDENNIGVRFNDSDKELIYNVLTKINTDLVKKNKTSIQMELFVSNNELRLIQNSIKKYYGEQTITFKVIC